MRLFLAKQGPTWYDEIFNYTYQSDFNFTSPEFYHRLKPVIKAIQNIKVLFRSNNWELHVGCLVVNIILINDLTCYKFTISLTLTLNRNHVFWPVFVV
jgi:hypothetical protein